MKKIKNISLSLFLFFFSCYYSNNDMETVYFLVSELTPTHNDSYILPLVKSEDIDFARELIKNPDSYTKKIVVARIESGSGDGNYLNKDLLDLNKRVWSWHIVEFYEFADIVAEIYDGCPTYIEDHLNEWINMTEGKIGFWNYTVSREVNIGELQ